MDSYNNLTCGYEAYLSYFRQAFGNIQPPSYNEWVFNLNLNRHHETRQDAVHPKSLQQSPSQTQTQCQPQVNDSVETNSEQARFEISETSAMDYRAN